VVLSFTAADPGQVVRRPEPGRGGHIPAAALTALASDEDRRRALEAGFQLHVPKPVDAARLASVVATLVEWKTSTEESTHHERST
jgi:hypothetical protein